LWPSVGPAGQCNPQPRLRPRPLPPPRASQRNPAGHRNPADHRPPRQPHGSGLGVYRWVVEQTVALLHWSRRLHIRWEIRDDIHEAFFTPPAPSSATADYGAHSVRCHPGPLGRRAAVRTVGWLPHTPCARSAYVSISDADRATGLDHVATDVPRHRPRWAAVYPERAGTGRVLATGLPNIHDRRIDVVPGAVTTRTDRSRPLGASHGYVRGLKVAIALKARARATPSPSATSIGFHVAIQTDRQHLAEALQRCPLATRCAAGQLHTRQPGYALSGSVTNDASVSPWSSQIGRPTIMRSRLRRCPGSFTNMGQFMSDPAYSRRPAAHARWPAGRSHQVVARGAHPGKRVHGHARTAGGDRRS
jgi:hypothetical protein